MKSVLFLNYYCYFVYTQSLRRSANLAADLDGGESGSDYGDWENDNWSMDSFVAPSQTRKTAQNKPQQNAKVREHLRPLGARGGSINSLKEDPYSLSAPPALCQLTVTITCSECVSC